MKANEYQFNNIALSVNHNNYRCEESISMILNTEYEALYVFVDRNLAAEIGVEKIAHLELKHYKSNSKFKLQQSSNNPLKSDSTVIEELQHFYTEINK